MVGALLTAPVDERCVTGVIFFDRNLVLGMCGHGMIGLIETLHRLGRIGPGEHLVETPVGVVPVVLADDGLVTFDNVASRLVERDVEVDVPSLGRVTGDIAYGGNVFFLVATPAVDLDQPRPELLRHRRRRAGRRPCRRVHRRRPRRAVRTADVPGCELAQLRAVSERDLRPLTVRHGHERQGRRAGSRRRARRKARRGCRSRSPGRRSRCTTGGPTGPPGRSCRRCPGAATVTGRGELFITREEHGG